MKKICIILLLVFSISAFSQNSIHQTSSQYQYQYPTDSAVKQKLENWRNLKFGMIIHWGLYAVPGIIESWQICNEDWITRDSTSKYDDYKKWYWGLNSQFNPTKFDPESWAKSAKSAGMKYVVFTTKHHDGFAMFNTQFSDFSISKGPFATNPKADVAKYVFDAFRKENFMIGAYYSKPDWHSQFFWWDRYATPDRNANYDIRKFPWRWNKFKEFTRNQINELTTNYGSIDILWLDGGWVRPLETVNDEVRSWGARIPEFNQEIDMPATAKMARTNQKGLLIVDRTVHGEFENYRTPEQSIPKTMSDTPWESCITLGDAWGYVPNDNFKTANKVIHSLIEVVAKGGSLLLGVGPTAEGTLLPVQIERLKQIGDWLNTNGEAIYNTRAIQEFHDKEVFFTKGQNATHYALVRIPEGQSPESIISWTGNLPKAGSKVTLLGEIVNLKWEIKDNAVQVALPKKMLEKYKSSPALAFKFEQ
ncbi:alpha-L-fucosidase [Arcicella sp. LKC2W]|uniref:alpha-L-fucosidase n=1 Tax=Arcicella sp. LKC2W TaxID=2984198 RepID=UPI002B214503|nr:alpha-L-fucosidase [Arcicella sp. LKC2W]MEA5460331.1 alpha-L-fucosidase [Arcicella sp. LKC2W]